MIGTFSKRIIAALLCSFLIGYEAYAQTASVVDNGTYGDIEWTFYSDGLLTVGGNGAIPDFNKSSEPSPNINDRPWLKHRKNVLKLIVQNGVTRVGNRAFQSFDKMTSAELAETVKSVGIWAFQNCYALEDVTMAKDVVLENGAFRDTPAEEEIAAVESEDYMNSDYFKNLCGVELTGVFRTDMINIALSQAGYHEGDSGADYGGGNTDGSGDFTEYGRFLSSSGNAWCSEFASWCIRMSGLPKSILNSSRGANASTFTKDTPSHYYKWSDLSFCGGSYTPRSGDLILWSWNLDNHNDDESLSHTSIFHHAETDGDKVVLHTIDGNSGNKVQETSFTVNKADGTLTSKTGQLYFLVAPDYENESTEKHTVYFDAAEGNVARSSKTVATGGLYGPLPIPTREGYKFVGWYTDPTAGKRINMYYPVRINIDQTLYAHWIEDSSNITTIKTETKKASRYNLYGMVVDNDYKGLYIENGTKKFIK